MNREEWAERLPLIQAFVEGKTIQFKEVGVNGPWEDISDPKFNMDYLEYRIKPEPKVIWCNEIPSLGGTFPHLHCYSSEEECRDKAYGANVGVAVKYVEVVE